MQWGLITRFAPWKSLLESRRETASPIVIPNHRHRNRNAPNGAAAEMGRIPMTVAFPAIE
jgi:hypothetical protein